MTEPTEKLSVELNREQDICGPRGDFDNKDFHGWAMQAEALEAENAALKARVEGFEDTILDRDGRIVELIGEINEGERP